MHPASDVVRYFRSRSRWVAIAATAVAFTIGLAAPAGPTFFLYYSASRSWLEGRLGPELYDAKWFAERTAQSPAGAVPDHLRYSPPTVALLTMPVAWMPPARAASAWAMISILAAFVGVRACYRMVIQLDTRAAGGILVIAGLSLLSSPIRSDLAGGQVYTLLFALVAVSLNHLRTGGWTTAGALMGVAAAAKTYGLWPMIGWCVAVHWQPLVVAVAVAASLLTVSLFAEGAVDTWRRYVDLVQQSSLDADVAVTAYQSLPAFLTHILRYDSRWNPEPVFNAPSLVTPVLLVAALAFVVSALPRIRVMQPHVAGTCMLVAGLIFSPRVEDYHFVLAIPAVCVGWVLVRTRSRRVRAVWLAGAVLILCDLPYEAASLSQGVLALLAYPRLYGAFIMGWLLLEVRPTR